MAFRQVQFLSFLAATIVAGCGGQNATSASLAGAASAGSAAKTVQAQRGAGALLYVTEASLGDVLIYKYAGGGDGIARIGKLTGFAYPSAPCTDRAGNVYIPDQEEARITEFAHGASSSQRTFADPKAFPSACAVDPVSGRLAVVNFKTYGGNANVVVFDKQTGRVARYADPDLTTGASVAYDSAGNLFVNGLDAHSKYRLYELAATGSQLVALQIQGATLHIPGRLQWTGSELLAGDQSYRGHMSSGAYRLSVHGTKAVVDAAIAFEGSRDVAGFCKRGTGNEAKIVAPDMAQNALLIYSFPGGKLERRIDGPFTPAGAVISQAGESGT
jgi:DNA-binding beta-propeller fold protein YncE